MKLLNGRGQLGKSLTPFLDKHPDVEIYHTWNFLDKSALVQAEEVKKFKKYLSKSDKKVIFISTTTQEDTSYLRCKRAAEELVLTHSEDNLVIRLPSIIGKGVFEGLRENNLQPYGIVRFVSLPEATVFILNSIGMSGIIECPSWAVSAATLVDLMEFCKK